MHGELSYLCFFLLYVSVFAKLNCTHNYDVLTVTYNDLVIFNHSDETPIFKLGIGNADFHNEAGNFVIDDTVSSEINLTKISDPGCPLSSKLEVTFRPSDDSISGEVKFLLNETTSATGENILALEANLSGDNGTYNRIFMNIYSTTKEKVYGGGEQYTYFNLKGHSFPIWTSEQGVGRDNNFIANSSNVVVPGSGGSYYTTYWPQASYFSSRVYSFFLNNRQYLELNFESAEQNTIYAHSTSLSGYFLQDFNVSNLVPRMAKLIGLQPVLPDWSLKGATLGLEYGTEEVLNRYYEAKDAGVDVNGLWVQDWSGTISTSFGYRVYWNWEYNDTLYEDFEGTIDMLSREGVQMLVYCNPHLIKGSPLFEEAEENGYFLTYSNGSTFLQNFGDFYGGTIDLVSEEARNWYSDTLRQNMVDIGIKGWMADFGEYTDLEMHSKNSSYSKEELHNMIPVAWAKANKQIVNGSEDVVYFMRSGGLGSSSGLKLAWAGDQNVDFSLGDGVASTIVAALNLALSGMGVTHFDIGGYTTIWPTLTRSRELLLRSAEYAVFTPYMRTHLGNKPDRNYQIFTEEETLWSFARLTQIHTRLFNYTRDIVKENSEKGIPVQRPMFYHYESDPDAWDVMYQYMYGPDLIVAPAIFEKQYEVSVYIPGGDNATWVPLWSEEGESEYQKGPKFASIPAPLGFPAVLYRLDSVYKDLFESINADFGGSPP